MRRVRRAALSYFNEFDLTMSVFVDWNLGFRCYNVVLIHSMSIYICPFRNHFVPKTCQT